MRGGDRSCAFGTLQDRLVNALALAGITDTAAANAFLREVYLPAHNARFAVPPAGEGSAFTPIPGVDLDDILCVEEERQVGHDNCVSDRTLKLQIPPSPMRPHFVKARVKVHVYADGSHAVFHGPRCIGRYDQNGTIRDAKTPPKSARRRASWTAWTSLRLAHPAHEAEQKQKKRTYVVPPKPDNLIRYRQVLSTGLVDTPTRRGGMSDGLFAIPTWPGRLRGDAPRSRPGEERLCDLSGASIAFCRESRTGVDG
jgi:hypothetical protein